MILGKSRLGAEVKGGRLCNWATQICQAPMQKGARGGRVRRKGWEGIDGEGSFFWLLARKAGIWEAIY